MDTGEAGPVVEVSEPDERSYATRARVNLRHWPGRSGWQPPDKPLLTTRLANRLVLYVVAMSERLALPEHLGLGAWRLALGPLVIAAGLFYDDALLERDPKSLRAVSQWAVSHPIDSVIGPCPLRVDSLTAFNQEAFSAHAYVGRIPVIGADLGRTLGLLADWWVPATRRGFVGGWSLGLRGWGVVVSRHNRADTLRWSTSYGRPLLYVKGVGVHGTRATFGYPRPNPEGMRRGVWVRGPSGREIPYPGVFLDVVGAAFALDGTDSSDLDDHLKAWGLPSVGAPFAVEVTPDGASVITECVEAVHRLALAIDSEAVRWG